MRYPIFLLVILFVGCNQPLEKSETEVILLNEVDEEFTDWSLLDYENDSKPGISLEKLYAERNLINKGEEVIVAIIDTKIDLDHEDLSGRFYINEDEVPGNNIDDDDNGYIDDTNGWNFLGYGNNETVYAGSGNHIRVIRKYQKFFEGKEESEVSPDSLSLYRLYQKAKEIRQNEIEEGQRYIDYGNTLQELWDESLKTFGADIVNEKITRETIDTIQPKNEGEERLLRYLDNIVTYTFYPDDFPQYISDGQMIRDSVNSLSNDSKLLTGDSSDNLNDIDYGNGFVDDVEGIFQHGTKMAGVIAATRGNYGGIKGISNNIKIMPISIFGLGYSHDKDFYLAVKYACDNGADIINFSSGQYISPDPSILQKAITYAAERDVLIVKAAGNESTDVDDPDITFYPLDYDDNGEEFSNNLVQVGASTQTVDLNLFNAYSNYGNKNVDLFAPGTLISVLSSSKEKYRWNHEDGTSLSSAYTSGVAALLKSHFPSLSAVQIKKILMDSGKEYNVDVVVGQDTVPFSSLSKSGKILNAYNAFLKAEDIVKK